VERNVQHGGKSGQGRLNKPKASASFDAKRLASFRMLLADSQADGSAVSYVDSVEAECRRLAAGLIAGEQVAA
jgi:hypothetical protein